MVHARDVHGRRSARRSTLAARSGVRALTAGLVALAVPALSFGKPLHPPVDPSATLAWSDVEDGVFAPTPASPAEATPDASADTPPADAPPAEPDTTTGPDTRGPANDGPEPGPTEDAAAEDAAEDDEPADRDEVSADALETDAAEAEAPRPPRIDGTYLGAAVFAGLGFARVNDLPTDGTFAVFGGMASVGQMVFPWLGLGLTGGGGGGLRSEQGARQSLGEGYLGIEIKLLPVPTRLPLSVRASFGFGGGAIRQEGVEGRAGFGGAQFGGAVRYELFPWAKRRRPYRGGGFGLGPELGWLGFTPAAAGRPMSNVIYLALTTTFYFGD
ncbi:MAG: hypothetical protein AAGF11_53080 [Myxococcota bacterium]